MTEICKTEQTEFPVMLKSTGAKEVLVSIKKTVDASPGLRSKKQLIEIFIAGINDTDDMLSEWQRCVVRQREQELDTIIAEEKLKSEDTHKFLENAFRDGGIKTAGTDIDRIVPLVPRFGSNGRSKKKQSVIDKR